MTRRPPAAGSSKNYEVGYGRPPIQHRFAKGTSGNPKGRPKTPKGSKRHNTLLESLERLANRKISLVLNGKRTTLSVMEAILVKTQQQALDGKQDAVRTLLGLQGKVDQWRREHPPLDSVGDFRDMDPNEASRVYMELMRGSR
jgi:hypothetical protein